MPLKISTFPSAKSFPRKFLGMVAKDHNIKQTFFSHIYAKQIFKILYTAVFCCESPFFKDLEAIIEETMKNLMQSAFRFSPYPEDKQTRSKLLDYGQVSFNLKDFLSDLTTNLVSVQLQLVQRLLNYIDDRYLQNLFSLFLKFRDNEQYEEYCEGIIYIFINILKLLEAFKLSVNTRYSQKDKHIKNQIESLLCANGISISSKLPSFTDFLMSKTNKTMNYSSGERIEIVGLLKFRVLQLVQKILSINQIQNMKIDFKSFDIFPILEMFMERYKWNNIAHNLLLKIVQHLVPQDYDNFKKRHIDNYEDLSKGLFGHLIVNFRNRKYVFLHSMRMINQGQRSLVFRISKTLITEMQERNDLSKLIDNFKIWKHYMLNDLRDYENNNYQLSLCFDSQNHQKQTKNSVANKFNDTNTPSLDNFHKPLQTIEQILIHFKEEEKWSPKHNPNKKQKDALLNNQSIKRMDSMAQYLPDN